MNLALVHLSDIHFKESGNPVTQRTKELASAISAADPAVGLYVVVVSGDIAYHGLKEEYAVALDFLQSLREQILLFRNQASVVFAAVPGNHDCYLPEEQTALRNALIAGLQPTLSNGEPDSALLTSVLEPQQFYWRFHDSLASSEPMAGQVCSVVKFEHENRKVQLNLFNTALITRNPEHQGSLHLPVKYIEEKISLEPDVALSVSVFHHSYLWIESNQAIQLRAFVERVSDIAMLGHQHYAHDYYKVNSTGERVLYLEGAALQDENYRQTSAFQVVIVDLEASKERSVKFRWSSKLYKNLEETEWRPLSINRAIRSQFRLNAEFEAYLEDVGNLYDMSDGPRLLLRDVFVFPDLWVRRQLPKPSMKEVESDKVVEYVLEAQKVVFQGGGLSGKTALAKSLFKALLANEIFPIIVSGESLKNYQPGKAAALFWKMFKEEYEDGMLDEFQQLPSTKRALIVDNWHRARLSDQGKQAFLQEAEREFGKILLFVDELFPIQEILDNSTQATLPYDSATLREFGFSLRGRLIEKWLIKGKEYTASSKELTNEIEQTEALVTNLIGKNTLPSIPFIVLCLLHTKSEVKSDAEAGSFGYLYEALVTMTLNASKSATPQLEKKYTLLARLAYRMFKEGVYSLSDSEVREVAAEYSASHLVRVDLNTMLEDLQTTRVLTSVDGNYSFCYSHLYQYFVARYYRDNLDRPGHEHLRGEIDDMVNKISSDRYTAILSFIIYFSKDVNRIIPKIAERADAIYAGQPLARLDNDVDYLNQFCGGPEITVPEEVDFAKNRKDRREFKDRMAKNEAALRRNRDREFTYSEDLSDAEKFELAHKHIELLGQVLRNFPGSLPGEEKLRILKSTYSLGLRLLTVLLRLLHASVDQYRSALTNVISDPEQPEQREQPQGIEDVKKLADLLITVVSRVTAMGTIKKIASSVGVADLEAAYSQAMELVGKTSATELINLAIEMEHSESFPVSKITRFHRDFSGKPFADVVLGDIVLSHLMIFDVNRSVRQSMTSLFKWKANSPLMLSSGKKKQ